LIFPAQSLLRTEQQGKRPPELGFFSFVLLGRLFFGGYSPFMQVRQTITQAD
jgi:hypothetical protein